MDEYIDYLEYVCRKIYDWDPTTRVKAVRRPEDARAFNSAIKCYMCEHVFSGKKNDKGGKNFDHDHLTRRYRGAACNSCNRKMVQARRSIVVYFHNYRGYDNHHIVHAFHSRPAWDLEPIAQNMEKFMTMNARFEVGDVKITVQFRDSYQVLSESLATLVESVGRNSLKQTLKMCNIYNVSEEVVLGKGVFPYSFFDSAEKLNYPRLPEISAFFDQLSQKGVDASAYQRAEKAWAEFNCLNFGDYMSRYLEMDVRQLCDVFEHFRATARREDGLDGAHYMTISQFALSAALLSVKKAIALCPTPEMYRLFESSIRGGISFCNTHYVAASNPHIEQSDRTLPIMIYL